MQEKSVIIKKIGGSIEIVVDNKTSKLLIKAKGYIGPSLIKQDLHKATQFGKEHPNGWFYIVDTTGVKVVNPLNILYLRKIPQLPNLSKYIVIVRSPVIKFIMKMGAPIVKPDHICNSIDEVAAYCKNN